MTSKQNNPVCLLRKRFVAGHLPKYLSTKHDSLANPRGRSTHLSDRFYYVYIAILRFTKKKTQEKFISWERHFCWHAQSNKSVECEASLRWTSKDNLQHINQGEIFKNNLKNRLTKHINFPLEACSSKCSIKSYFLMIMNLSVMLSISYWLSETQSTRMSPSPQIRTTFKHFWHKECINRIHRNNRELLQAYTTHTFLYIEQLHSDN